ncbi:MAG: hypothetical protein HOP29_04190 [Phycisphaerales bacterium]|nr:hypothetical protein [Phycisphaerales bacterium]
MNKTTIRTLSVLAVVSVTSVTLAARNALQMTGELLPAGTPNLGVFGENGPGAGGGVEIIYDSNNGFNGFFSRPLIGSIFADDIITTFDNVQGGIIDSYNLAVIGSLTSTAAPANCPAEAAIPFDVTTGIWADSESPPDPQGAGQPLAPIAGATCNFIGVPKGAVFTLNCNVGVPANGQFWVTTQFSSHCGGWMGAGAAAPAVGDSADFFGRSLTGGATWSFFFFGGCASTFGCASFNAQILGHEAGPDACCDSATDLCSNEFPGDCQGADQVYTEGVLCNDLSDLCSDAGACCDTLTGDCSASFASLCSGIFEEFTAGALCADVTCVGGDDVPTVSQWGMIALTVILLSGLTIKFGRRRAVTA